MSRWKLPCSDLSFPHTLATLAALLVAAGAQVAPPAAAPARQPAAVNHAVEAARLQPRLAQFPLAFEANQGQTDSRAQFLARSAGSVVFLTARGAVVKTTTGAVRMDFVGAAPAHGQGRQRSATTVSYLTGPSAGWHPAVPSFGQVRYAGLYPGVDLVYYGHRGMLEYDLRLAPGADSSRIQLAVAGASPRLAAQGELRLGASISLHAPQAYQTIAGHRRAVAVRYARRGHHIGFQLGAYDPSQALVIDPVLAFSTLLGGTNYNQANAVAVDSTGAGYVAGYTLSADFPVVGAIQANLAPGSFGPAFDAFVSKISADGTTLVYSTYLGGNGDDEATGIAVDASNNAYVTGFTSSTNFPTVGAEQAANGGGYDAFVAKLNPTGAALVYSTYLGGSQDDKAAAIAVDGSGDAFIAGATASANFPTSVGAPQTAFGGAQDAFVAALNPTGSALLYSTYLGGTAVDRATGIAVDQTGNAYVSGATASADFPATTGALQTAIAGGFDGFVAKVDRSGRSFGYVTYLGGSKADEVNAIAVDAAGHAFVTGDTSSINIFPTASSAFQQSFGGGSSDAFVAELNNSGSAMVYGTYLGGSSTDVGTGIAVDGADGAFVTGFTSSSDFPTTSNATQIAVGGVQDAFLSKFDSVGQKLLFSTYFGGLANDAGEGIGLDATGELYVVGVTSSSNFPVTTGVLQATVNSQNDAFVTKFVTAPQGVFSPTALGFPAQASTVASTAESVIFTNGGEKPLIVSGITTTGPYTETDNCNANSSTLQPGATCTLSVVFKPTAAGAQNGTLVVSDNAPGGSQTLPLSGTGGDFSLTVAPTTITIAAGSSASFSLNVTPAIGYTQVVALTCTGAPTQSTCTASPTSLTMNGNTASTATFTVTTTVRPALVPALPAIPPGPWTWLAVLALGLAAGLLLYATGRRLGANSRRLGWLGTALLLGWAVAAFGCGGTTSNPGTPAGNYTLSFVGTAGSTAHTQTATLTVD